MGSRNNGKATMSSLILDEMRRTYAAQRGVSQGASVTLTAVSGGFQARFDCARRCAAILGDQNYDRITDIIFIPTEEVCASIQKLSQTLSVALVDTTTDETGTRFVLVWKILPKPDLVPVVDGTIFDPTREQFPSKGFGIYTPFDGTVECSECGKTLKEEEAQFESRYCFCSTRCHMRFVGL